MALANYFLAVAFAFFEGALAAAFGAAATLVTTGTAAVFNAVRCSRSAAISALILSLRSVSLAMLALILANALAVLETTGAFFAAAFATGFADAVGFTDFAGAAIFLGAGALDATFFFAVAMISFYFDNPAHGSSRSRIVLKIAQACAWNLHSTVEATQKRYGHHCLKMVHDPQSNSRRGLGDF
jgi:hypothetical protein